MLINLNTDTFFKSRINAHQFVIAMFILKNKLNDLEAYLERTFSVERVNSDLDWLWKQGFLMEFTPGPSMIPTDCHVTQKFRDLFYSNKDMFEEFYDEYPVKAVRPNGDIDYLRADKDTARHLYGLQVRGDKQVHDHIIRCLRYEVKNRYASSKLPYMKRLNKWLSTREWESYEDEVDDTSSAATRNEGEYRYGTELG